MDVHRERLAANFTELCEIDSPSRQEGRMSARLRQLFQGQRPEDGFFQRDIMTKRPEQLSIAQLVQLTNEVGEQLQKIEKSAGGGEKTADSVAQL